MPHSIANRPKHRMSVPPRSVSIHHHCLLAASAPNSIAIRHRHYSSVSACVCQFVLLQVLLSSSFHSTKQRDATVSNSTCSMLWQWNPRLFATYCNLLLQPALRKCRIPNGQSAIYPQHLSHPHSAHHDWLPDWHEYAAKPLHPRWLECQPQRSRGTTPWHHQHTNSWYRPDCCHVRGNARRKSSHLSRHPTKQIRKYANWSCPARSEYPQVYARFCRHRPKSQ